MAPQRRSASLRFCRANARLAHRAAVVVRPACNGLLEWPRAASSRRLANFTKAPTFPPARKMRDSRQCLSHRPRWRVDASWPRHASGSAKPSGLFVVPNRIHSPARPTSHFRTDVSCFSLTLFARARVHFFAVAVTTRRRSYAEVCARQRAPAYVANLSFIILHKPPESRHTSAAAQENKPLKHQRRTAKKHRALPLTSQIARFIPERRSFHSFYKTPSRCDCA